MLNSFYHDIVDHLKEDLKELALPPQHFGVHRANNTSPFFEVTGRNMDVKVPVFKKTSQEVKLLSTSEKFTITGNPSKKKGPYLLRLVPEGVTAVMIITAPETPNANITQLNQQEYSIQAQELTLIKEYPEGSQLAVSYTYAGLEHTDRYEQFFSINIYEQDPLKIEQYSLLALASAWSSWESLTGKAYRQSSGNLETIVKVTELGFSGQSNPNEGALKSQLGFTLNGMLTLIRAKDGGLHRIERVEIGEESVAIDQQGGLTINRK